MANTNTQPAIPARLLWGLAAIALALVLLCGWILTGANLEFRNWKLKGSWAALGHEPAPVTVRANSQFWFAPPPVPRTPTIPCVLGRSLEVQLGDRSFTLECQCPAQVSRAQIPPEFQPYLLSQRSRTCLAGDDD